MRADESQLDRIQQHQLARFRGMGLSVRPMPDGKSLLVSLPLGPAPFESIVGPLVIERVVFSTVGHDQIKCLRPRQLFGLPLIDIRDCKSATAVESVLRRAWRERTRKLRDAARWLTDLGIDVRPNRNGTILGFSLAGEVPNAKVLLEDRHAAILPSTGPLSGIALSDIGERVIPLSGALGSSADLECLISARIESLLRTARSAKNAEKKKEVLAEPSIITRRRATASIPTPHRQPKVLLVGPNLVEDAALREELSSQGYRIATARSETEALVRLASMTPDLVLSEYALGRSDGATLIQATRGLAGIEIIPVVLLDDTAHENRRSAARAVGAAGYVILPPERTRFVARLGQLLAEPSGRRFTRYPERLSARLQGLNTPCMATEVGRGGAFIATEAEFDLHSATHCEIALPDVGRNLRFEGEILYRSEDQGTPSGLGLRFADISSEDEAALIEYLIRLESRR